MLFYVQVAEFQPPDTVKNYFTGAFQAFYTKSRSSHSKAFIYLKSAHDQCKNSQVTSQASVWNLITLDHNVVKTLDMMDC